MASRVPGIGPCLGSESPDGVWRVDACDADGDNFVSGEELLQHSIAGLDIAVRLDEAAAKFDVLDLDADGYVTREDVVRWLGPWGRRAFVEMDGQRTGVVTFPEFVRAVAQRGAVKVVALLVSEGGGSLVGRIRLVECWSLPMPMATEKFLLMSCCRTPQFYFRTITSQVFFTTKCSLLYTV
mmetsp:Transcript_4760/g.10201  ORF Transcript_4760/g.10201 Transcript_4760/m.10201 type:complete len:182 (-) Transcript_4760:1045-1590(-)